MYGFEPEDFVRRKPDNLVGQILWFDGEDVVIKWFHWNKDTQTHEEKTQKHDGKILWYLEKADKSYLLVDVL